VAGCTGSGFRRLAALAAIFAAVNAGAQTPVPVQAGTALATPAVDVARKQGRHETKMDRNTKKIADGNPDSAMLEYLGEYGDTADGLDPMGLADPDAPTGKSNGGEG
jgi:hypothetical protein